MTGSMTGSLMEGTEQVILSQLFDGEIFGINLKNFTMHCLLNVYK